MDAHEIAQRVREGKPVRLPPTDPLFAATRTYPEGWRRATFGDAAIDAELAEREANRAPGLEATVQAQDLTIAGLRKALARAHDAHKKEIQRLKDQHARDLRQRHDKADTRVGGHR